MSSNQFASFGYGIPANIASPIKNISANYSVNPSDNGVLLFATGASGFQIELPSPEATGNGFAVTIFNNTGSNSSAQQLIINVNKYTGRIDGLQSTTIYRGQSITIFSNGSQYTILSRNKLKLYAENPYDYTQVLPVVAGLNSVAIGVSYAGSDSSIALANATNASSQGARNIGAISMGNSANVTGYQAVAIGYFAAASGTDSLALGRQGTASGERSCGINNGNAVQYGKFAYGVTGFDNQTGMLVLIKDTTNATPGVLNSSFGATATSTNQVILPNNSAYAFTGTVVARRQAAGGTESAAWKVEGLIRREGAANTTTLVASTVTAISNVPGWTLALSADTTNGGLKVEATGAASTNIRWVATIQTSEVTYA